ncbi:DUF6308 family protein [Nesterenkonia sp. NBAIMH1]|uniref:DUF6308 family protein n=1 Tax=Nesterenkonia sp. NBAIMH1 TaxID=2600320 RepID=UPI00352F97EB
MSRVRGRCITRDSRRRACDSSKSSRGQARHYRSRSQSGAYGSSRRWHASASGGFLTTLKATTQETAAQDSGARCEFYDLVKDSLAKAGTKASSTWVTASKVTARKRPKLFPVRDSEVCKLLGMQDLGDRENDWCVFRELMLDSEIQNC